MWWASKLKLVYNTPVLLLLHIEMTVNVSSPCTPKTQNTPVASYPYKLLFTLFCSNKSKWKGMTNIEWITAMRSLPFSFEY